MKKLALIAFLTAAIVSCESVNKGVETPTVDSATVVIDTVVAAKTIDSTKSTDSAVAPTESASLKVTK